VCKLIIINYTQIYTQIKSKVGVQKSWLLIWVRRYYGLLTIALASFGIWGVSNNLPIEFYWREFGLWSRVFLQFFVIKYLSIFFQKLKKLLKFTLELQIFPNLCSKYNKNMSKKTTALKIVFKSMNQIWWRNFLLSGLDWLLSFLKLPWMSIGLRRILFSKLDWGKGDPMSN